MMADRQDYEVAVIGGGLVGVAIGWGLARLGQRVAVLDEGDVAYRASRGNFALVWVQSKGLGMPEYAAWTRRSSDGWFDFAQLLKEETGLDPAFQRPGGFHLCLSEAELAARAGTLNRLHNQPRMVQVPYEILERARSRSCCRRSAPRSSAAATVPSTATATRCGCCARCTRGCSSGARAICRTISSRRSSRAAASSGCRRRAATSPPARSCWPPATATRDWGRWSGSMCRCGRSAARSW